MSSIRRGEECLIVAIAVAGGLSSILSCMALASVSPSQALAIARWSAAQWMPFPFHAIATNWQGQAWNYWEDTYQPQFAARGQESAILDIPRVKVQDFADPADLLRHLEDTHGTNWRQRPLLLEGLWDADGLLRSPNNSPRRISKEGLLQENLTIPYFRDARVYGALAPNDEAPVRDIVANITKRGAPYKIGTQFLVQTYPELIHEVAPIPIVTALFGDHFRPDHVVGAFGLPFLPATTTVPLFVAGTMPLRTDDEDASKDKASKQPFTALHCEPIGNVAVQLEGEKHWTLVSPEYTFLLKPSTSPDGRAFFVSGHSSDTELRDTPRYYVTTRAGDALWVPTWTWHRVDYGGRGKGRSDPIQPQVTENQIAIGASLFHLRPMELVTNNPLFAFLVIPNLVKEVIGFNTQ